MRKHSTITKIAALALSIMLVISVAAPFSACAEESKKEVVRVGWHEPPFFITDQYGRHSGYSYEYQCKLAAYTGWEYEYVEGSWVELMEKLKTGEIDMLSNVSYLEERTDKMLFSSIPMGTEAYYLFVSPGNKEIKSDNFATLNGKRVGVTKNSMQEDFLVKWAKSHEVTVDIQELTIAEDDAMNKLGSELDALVTMDIYSSPEKAVPVWKIGSSDFYFAVSKDRPDILAELDAALNRIQEENKYYDQQLHDKYLKSGENNRYLNASEREWLEGHGTIRIGYQDNYLAFCAADPDTGELTGALKDYLEYASGSFKNADIKFQPVSFPTAASALEALKSGEIDCMFPANLTSYDAEQLGLVMTPPLMRTEMDAVVRASEQKEFIHKENVTIAVNEGNTNYEIFLADNYPTWTRKYFKDTPSGLEGVANHEADCVIISNYRYSNISKQCEKLHLTTVYTGVDIDYCFAVREGDIQLYSILARVTNVVPGSAIHTALTFYSTEDVKTSFFDYIKENLIIVLAAVALILFIIVLLLLRSIKAEKKIAEDEHLVKALNKKVFVDALTSVRNKGAYSDYLAKLQERIDNGEQFDIGIGIFDCNDLKVVNDQYGHDKGDLYLKAACQLICKVFDHSPVFRMGGDEFAVILLNGDFNNRDALVEQFEKRRREICDRAENKWEEIHIALGIAVYDPENDSSLSDTVRRADRYMYENKRISKGGKS